MSDSPKTRHSLLVKIRRPDDSEAWHSFVEIYAPLIHAYAQRRGMQDADAADLTQQVMRSVFDAIPRFEYDPAKGTFRGWLLTITRNHMLKAFQKRNRTPTATGDTAFQEKLNRTVDEAADEESWNRDHEVFLFKWAADRVRGEFRESTWQCFWMTAVENIAAADVASRLNVSTGAVYIAKSRVLARIKEVVSTIED